MASRPMIVMIGLGAVAALAVAGTALGAAAQDVTGGAGSPSPAVVASESGQETTSVPRTGTDGRPIWEVEVVADGVEWDLDIDRVTGDIVKVDRDDDDDRRDR
ncbi:PepSY domain-containing protein [Solwaraspora sp. WMMA2065]|uniref:PepSY domain-containing protein n=1 Tax=Solwaraspora sp. WMMA2065 TaxID=3015166 RepID=UPI00259BCD40|nr:PepSY domain-containing protein [Solwaraspora sp. WMMA2065]WJK36745.1 PepSY domain-containing protein [Solwaraspora sp. WMMA2065]